MESTYQSLDGYLLDSGPNKAIAEWGEKSAFSFTQTRQQGLN